MRSSRRRWRKSSAGSRSAVTISFANPRRPIRKIPDRLHDAFPACPPMWQWLVFIQRSVLGDRYALARDSRIGGLMNRVRCGGRRRQAQSGILPGWLEIRLRDGREFVFDQRWEKGTPRNQVDGRGDGEIFQ